MTCLRPQLMGQHLDWGPRLPVTVLDGLARGSCSLVTTLTNSSYTEFPDTSSDSGEEASHKHPDSLLQE